MANKIIEMKKENKVKKWFEDHSVELVVAGSFIVVTGLLAAVYACGYSNGKGPQIDEWVPAPIRDKDGNVGVTMLGLRNLDDVFQIVDSKEYFYEKHEYAANFANGMLDMIKEVEQATE